MKRVRNRVTCLALALVAGCGDDGASAPADLLAAIGETTATEQVVHELGSVAQATGTGIALRVRRAYMAHASIAPSCAIATWRDGQLEVYSHTQGPHGRSHQQQHGHLGEVVWKNNHDPAPDWAS